MYAQDGDDFRKCDISGVIDACESVSDVQTWCKRLPREWNGVAISTAHVLIDTKRSASNYVNVIEHHTARFCLDRRSNSINTFLLEQAANPVKVPIRLAEYLCKGSTTILDCGDHHVVGRFDKGVMLRRLKKSTVIPSGRHFKHPSEKCALATLRQIFSETDFYVNYEPFVINFSDESVVINGNSVHCYNVDFTVRKKTSGSNVGIEVKRDISSWEWKKAEGFYKMQKYEKIMGAPCLVLAMHPSPQFFFVGDGAIEAFSSAEDVLTFVHALSR